MFSFFKSKVEFNNKNILKSKTIEHLYFKNFYFLLENTSLSNEDLLIDFVSGNKLNMDVINFFDIHHQSFITCTYYYPEMIYDVEFLRFFKSILSYEQYYKSDINNVDFIYKNQIKYSKISNIFYEYLCISYKLNKSLLANKKDKNKINYYLNVLKNFVELHYPTIETDKLINIPSFNDIYNLNCNVSVIHLNSIAENIDGKVYHKL